MKLKVKYKIKLLKLRRRKNHQNIRVTSILRMQYLRTIRQMIISWLMITIHNKIKKMIIIRIIKIILKIRFKSQLMNKFQKTVHWQKQNRSRSATTSRCKLKWASLFQHNRLLWSKKAWNIRLVSKCKWTQKTCTTRLTRASDRKINNNAIVMMKSSSVHMVKTQSKIMTP